MSRPRRPRRGVRVLVATVLLVAMGGLFAGLSAQLIGGHRADLQRTAMHRQAVPYLRAVSQLIADLVEARSAAVRGEADPPANLRVSMATVSDVDVALGGPLETGLHWLDLQTTIDGVLAGRHTGVDAADPYADLVTMATDLFDEVSAASRLEADPEPASRSLVLAVRELMSLVVATGQAADVSTLAGDSNVDGAPDEVVDLAVALRDTASAYRALVGMLTTSVDTGSRPPFTLTAIEKLNLIHDVLDGSVGPAALRPSTVADQAALNGMARQVRELARSTIESVLDELDGQLAGREAALRNEMLLAAGTAGAGLILGLVVLWWSAVPPSPERGHEALVDGPDVASVSVELPAVDARELLALEELVHVGRGVRARPSRGGDDAE